MHIGILTGGGDCPGLNAVIRAVALALINECGARVFSVAVDPDLTVDCVVTSDDSPLQGTLYDIELTVTSPQGKVYALDAERYLPDAEVAP